MNNIAKILILSYSGGIRTHHIGITPDKDYKKYLSLIESHTDLAKSAKNWETHIVEYKLKNFPLIAPFYYSETGSKISFKVPKLMLGKVPTELVYESFSKDIKSEIKKIDDKISINNIVSSKVLKFKGNYDSPSGYPISYYAFNKTNKEAKLELGYLKVYEKNPSSWTRETAWGPIDVTLQEVIDVIDDPSQFKSESARLKLKEWVKSSSEDIKGFPKRKKELISKIEKEVESLRFEQKKLTQIENEIKNRASEVYIIDAFLRGWVFNVNDETLNKQLDEWYDKRESVWKYILDNVPNSRINNKLAGIFHSDDVFFQIEADKDNFIITPYKVVGGEFIQIIDKKIGISYLQSPFNHRLSQN